MPKKTIPKNMDLERDIEEVARPKTNESQEELYLPRSSSLGKIAFTFIGFAILLLLGIFYFSYSYTTIIVTPNPQAETFETEVEASLPLAKTEGALDEMRSVFDTWTKNNPDKLFAETIDITIDGSDKFIPSGESSAAEEPGIAHGKITIVNDQTTEQELIAKTRFVPEGSDAVFRIKQDVKVPANGKLEVEVFADEPGSKGNVGPSKFYLPGFTSEAKRKVVYAQSAEPMAGGVKKIKTLAQADIDNAKLELEKRLFNEALVKLEEKIKGATNEQPAETTDNRLPTNAEEKPEASQKPALITENAKLLPKATVKEIIEAKNSGNVGEAMEEFTMNMKLKVTALIFSEEKLVTLAKKNITKNVADQKTVKPHSIDDASLNYTLKSLNSKNETAQINVTLQGTTVAGSASILSKEQVASLNSKNVKTFLKNHPEIKSIEIKEAASWIRKIPFMKEHVRVKVNQP